MKKLLFFLLVPLLANAQTKPRQDSITLAGGCYWCVEAIYENLKGVSSVVSGYAGGSKPNPTYEQVSTGTTGYAEAVQITFDPTVTSRDEILKIFFSVHDPTTLNRQGADVGTQYRSAIFYKNETEKKSAQSLISALTKAQVFKNPIVTTLEPLTKFYKAENYHQNYFVNNPDAPYCQMVIAPKVEKFEKVFKDRLKKK